MKKCMTAMVLSFFLILAGCGRSMEIRRDSYEYLIGVSLTNVMEPWLNNLAQVIEDKAEGEDQVNLIIRDAAGSAEKQIQDIQSLMECGVDLLIVSPGSSTALDGIMEDVFANIPIVVVGVEPETESYTALIQADDEKIGQLAGEYILDNFYEEGDRIAVIQGVDGSFISGRRQKGFLDVVEEHVGDGSIVYYFGDWLRDIAESRMKDYLVVNGAPDIVFAFNDEMAYGAYLACQQLRMGEETRFIGVDGFEGESEGLNLVEQDILDATIQSPDFGELAYDTAMRILKGEDTERNITVVPRLITGE